MSYFPLLVIHPQPFSRHVIEVWEYQWNPVRQDYDRVCYRPLQLKEPGNNPNPNVDEMTLFPTCPIRLNVLDRETIDRLTFRPRDEVRRPVPPPDHRPKLLVGEEEISVIPLW